MAKTGTIALPGAANVVSCIVHELSETGAHLKVAAADGLPLHFVFATTDRSPQKASVVWWDIGAVGVRFNDK